MNPYPSSTYDWAAWATVVIASGKFFVEKKVLTEVRDRIRELRAEADCLEREVNEKINALNNATKI